MIQPVDENNIIQRSSGVKNYSDNTRLKKLAPSIIDDYSAGKTTITLSEAETAALENAASVENHFHFEDDNFPENPVRRVLPARVRKKTEMEKENEYFEEELARDLMLHDTWRLYNQMLTNGNRTLYMEESKPLPIQNNAYKSLFYGSHMQLYQTPCLFFSGAISHPGTEGERSWSGPLFTAPHLPTSRKMMKLIDQFLVLDRRDLDILHFLARFSFTTPYALAILTGQCVADIVNRMAILTRAGIVRTYFMFEGPLYYLSAAGAAKVGIDRYPQVKGQSPSIIMLKHNYLVCMLAAELERGRLLLDGQVPYYRRVLSHPNAEQPHGAMWGTIKPTDFENDIKTIVMDGKTSVFRRGECLVSEYEIRSRKGVKKDKDKINKTIDPKDELSVGNEDLFCFVNPLNGKMHVPDLVVKRPRGANGEPQSICIEVEIVPKLGKNGGKKQSEKYYKDLIIGILSCGYFGKLIYFTPTRRVYTLMTKLMTEIEKNPPPGMCGKPGERLELRQISFCMGSMFDSIFTI